MIIDYMFNPGDIIGQHWKIEGKEVLTALYLIYDKEDRMHSYDMDVGYTSYKCYVMYSYCPYGREDRSGLPEVVDIYDITQWSDMDTLNPTFPCDWTKMVESGLSWEDVD